MVSDPNDVFGPVAPETPAPDDVFGPVTSSHERYVALKAFGPCVTPGRPSGYNDATVDAILDAIMGGQTLEQTSKIEGLPHKATILRWADRYPEFAAMLERAFEWRTLLRCDEIIDIADNSTGDYVREMPKNEGDLPAMTFRKNNVVRAKLQIDARFKIMAAENPKRYGINHPRPPDQPALDTPRNPLDAKNITDQTAVFDLQPLREQLAALRAPTPKQGE
jgi:hypothetical protein